jgi:S1-C subfamily serine protease
MLLILAPIGMLTKIVLTPEHPSSFTVMVTNMEENSGGSGSIIETSRDKSWVLTNAHVCHVLDKDGGFVKKEDGTKFLALGYELSKTHDLCKIAVAADLGGTVKIANEAPKTYSDAIITGHPALLPNVINKGSFGERKVVHIVTSIKACTQEDAADPVNGVYCFIIGGIPVVTAYESVTVSAIIMGGSSGSAVLNANGELSGVVFAGQGSGLSYAFIVPYEYVSMFLKDSGDFIKIPLVDNENKSEETKQAKLAIIKACKLDKIKTRKICDILSQDLGVRGLRE